MGTHTIAVHTPYSGTLTLPPHPPSTSAHSPEALHTTKPSTLPRPPHWAVGGNVRAMVGVSVRAAVEGEREGNGRGGA